MTFCKNYCIMSMLVEFARFSKALTKKREKYAQMSIAGNKTNKRPFWQGQGGKGKTEGTKEN